jgi:hypothetical protein
MDDLVCSGRTGELSDLGWEFCQARAVGARRVEFMYRRPSRVINHG